MIFRADLHIHSKYSRATSKDMDLEGLDKWARIKGIKVLGTGDFTHPEWLENLKDKLEPAEKGLFKLKKSSLKDDKSTRFMLTSEISCIYSKNGRVRKIHILVFAPSFEIVEKINAKLSLIGNLKADGRPILGLDAKELLKIVLDVSTECLVVPAHCMTPWFGIFGSKSGFDSIQECFEDLSDYIFAIETGLSADCPMLWRMSDLDNIALISNSDAHSPEKLGREVNVFDTQLDYFSIIEAIKTKNPNKFIYTVEFFPEEGKYHYDGHRACDVCLTPKESEKYNNICPVCGKPLTIGVLNRINVLADREQGFKPKNAIPFKSLVPLKEIIAEVVGTLPGSKRVKTEYENLIQKFESEFEILLNSSYKDLEKATLPKIAEGVIRVRQGKVNVLPGYDGVFGKVEIFSKTEKQASIKQDTLF
ncbi:MAG: endonuclease Q family protein [Patescibacteria group bacterium]|nr:endonuclease Q family protein [Patescibacteria group bacterium]